MILLPATHDYFVVYSDFASQTVTGVFETYDEAKAALQTGYALRFPAEYEPLGIVDIEYDDLMFINSQEGDIFRLAEGITDFRLEGDGNSTIIGGDTNGKFYGSNGDNTMTAGDGGISLVGRSGDDVLVGGDGNDRLFGNQDNDSLFGGAGSDILNGGDGDDHLFAGDGTDFLYGEDGADTFHFALDANGKSYIKDFDATEGDTIELEGTYTSFDDLMAAGAVTEASGHVTIKEGTAQIIVQNTSLADVQASTTFVTEADTTINGGSFDTFAEFLDTGLDTSATEVDIAGTTYLLRDDEPLHADYKYQDSNGQWWSPDYFVLVAGGQSNMFGSGQGGDTAIDPNVMAYDYINGEIVVADYDAAPAGGTGIKPEGTTYNNLYFPLANDLAAELDRPVLVVTHAVPGTTMSMWNEDEADPEAGALWRDLNTDVENALTAIGQDKADLFVWHQGESDFTMDPAQYEQEFMEFVAQVRATEWGGDDLAFLAGELSRQGDNYHMNEALQNIETTETDPNLGFVSSVGITTFGTNNIHFDGEGLVEFGHRYFDAYMDILAERENPGSTATGDTAPVFDITPEDNSEDTYMWGDPDPSPGQTMALDNQYWTIGEGYSDSIYLSDGFSDAEGDALSYYVHIYGANGSRGHYFGEIDGDKLTIDPTLADAGDYEVHVFASDGELDSETVVYNLTVEESEPTVVIYDDSTYTSLRGEYLSLRSALDDASSHRGMEILSLNMGEQMGGVYIDTDSLHIKGDSSMGLTFNMSDDILRIYFDGEAEFDANGNALNNNIEGNAGDNIIRGYEGIDWLYGEGGNDMLDGGADIDRLFGGAGDDYIIFGSGNDQAYGDAGADMFVFADGDETNQIRDFAAAEGDSVVVLFDGIDDYDTLMATATLQDDTTNNRVIVNVGDDRVIIWGIQSNELTSDMFQFTDQAAAYDSTLL